MGWRRSLTTDPLSHIWYNVRRTPSPGLVQGRTRTETEEQRHEPEHHAPADPEDRLRQVFVPTVIEEGNRGDRAFDIYSQLLRERIVFLGQEVDDQVANLIISQMLFLEAQNSERDIYLYINSPGGVAYAGMAIYDVMQHVEPDVSTICVGMGMSAAAMILSGGAAGKRFALPNARIMIHQGSAGTRGAPSDMEIQLREVLSLTRRMSEIIAHHSGQPLERVAQDIDRDYYMTSEEARDYGIIDDIILPRRGLCAPGETPSTPLEGGRQSELQVATA